MMKDLENLVELEKEKYYKQLFDEEGISKNDLGLVDLSIGFSPVMTCATCLPVEAVETIGGDFIVRGYAANPVSPEILKVMRYRYLMSKYRVTWSAVK